MDGAQDWCLQCGTGAPGSLSTPAPSWRSAAVVLGVSAILVAGAATAAYAAWGKEPTKSRHVLEIVAQTPAPTTTAPAPGASTPAVPKGIRTPTTIKPTRRRAVVKPPKIPVTARIPVTSSGNSQPSTSSAGQTTTTPSQKTTTSGSSTTSTEPQPTAITLDTNAAATYNPYNYPSSRFGDPSLAIDGETATSWTAQVDPAVAPKMAEGLVIDLKTARKLSAVGLVTSTPGMTVQVYGANGSALPTSITDPTWVQLSSARVEKNKHSSIKLRDSSRAFRFVTLWISKAPASSIGTPQAPGHVSVNELELFSA
jgi:hypothetical protein